MRVYIPPILTKGGWSMLHPPQCFGWMVKALRRATAKAVIGVTPEVNISSTLQLNELCQASNIFIQLPMNKT